MLPHPSLHTLRHKGTEALRQQLPPYDIFGCYNYYNLVLRIVFWFLLCAFVPLCLCALKYANLDAAA